MTDQRGKVVLSELADLYSRMFFCSDLITNLRAPLSYNETIEVPNIGALTVYSDGSSSQSAQSVSNAVISLTANKHPWVPALLPAVSQMQNLNGQWAGAVARQAGLMLKNNIDEEILGTYIARSVCWDTGASYVDNVAGDSLAAEDIVNCKAALMSNDGVMPQDIALFVSPFGEASIQKIVGFSAANPDSTQGLLGIQLLGKVAGVSIYSTNSVLRNHTVATTAAVTTGTGVTHTYTVAAGHGLLPGMLVTVAGHDSDENVATPTAITSVTSTTVVVTTSATTDGTSSDATGVITCAKSFNVMMNRAQMFVAQQRMPSGRIVPDLTTTGDVLQVSALYGRVGRAGHARLLMSPGSAA